VHPVRHMAVDVPHVAGQRVIRRLPVAVVAQPVNRLGQRLPMERVSKIRAVCRGITSRVRSFEAAHPGQVGSGHSLFLPKETGAVTIAHVRMSMLWRYGDNGGCHGTLPRPYRPLTNTIVVPMSISRMALCFSAASCTLQGWRRIHLGEVGCDLKLSHRALIADGCRDYHEKLASLMPC